MLPENYYEKQRERSRLNYHRRKEQYRQKYEEHRERCIAYMKGYNKQYYQERREEILRKQKAHGHDVRTRAGCKTKNIYIPPEPNVKKVAASSPPRMQMDPSVFTILFDD
jgi:hypothetical protein